MSEKEELYRGLTEGGSLSIVTKEDDFVMFYDVMVNLSGEDVIESFGIPLDQYMDIAKILEEAPVVEETVRFEPLVGYEVVALDFK